jgi:putative endopeptidase
VLPGLFVNGQNTVGENVADLGGVQVAYDALEHRLAANGRSLPSPPFAEEPAFLRLTQEQRFFVAWATVWREKARDEFLITLIRTDPHPPLSVRGTMPIRNMDAFFAAFGIHPGDPMYLPPGERVVVW